MRSRAPRMVRAADVARHFEVSTRTIERDLLALQQAGVPIWAQPGPGGGYSLNVETTLPPLNLTPAEAAAIATALAAPRRAPRRCGLRHPPAGAARLGRRRDDLPGRAGQRDCARG